MDVCLGCGEETLIKNRRRLHLMDAGRKVKDIWESFLMEYCNCENGYDELVNEGYMCRVCFSAFEHCQFERYYHQQVLFG